MSEPEGLLVSESEGLLGRPGRSSTRFKVLGFGLGLAAVTYLDRICISLTRPHMMRDLGLTEVQMGFVFSSFTLAYALFEVPTGWWGDRIGPRKVLARIVIWWSCFTIATAAVSNYVSLLVIRFLFGAGEAGAWPNSAKAISRWFPPSERGTAQGIFFAGAHLGGGLTPLLVTALLVVVPWRLTFVIFGAVGFVWAAAWYWWFRDDPAQHPAVSPSELEHIRAGRGPDGGHGLAATPWRRVMRSRSLLALSLMYATQGYGFYYIISWLPKYLEEERGFTSTRLGIMAGMPLLLSVLADLGGGWTTDRVSRAYGLRLGRSGVGGLSLLIAGVSVLAGCTVEDPLAAAMLISLGGAMSNFLLGACWGTCHDISGGHTGVVTACMNTAGQVGGILSPIVTAYVAKGFSNNTAPLYIVGLCYLVGAACWWFVDPRERIEGGTEPDA